MTTIREVFILDNPGGEWLERQQKKADEKSREASIATAAEKGISGSVTAASRGAVWLPSEMLKYVPGCCDESPAPGNGKYDRLMARLEKDGWDHEQDGNAVLLGINHYGRPFLMEGNNRVAVANAEGIDVIRVDIRYWNGGEEAGGKFSPDRVIENLQPDPRHSPSFEP